MTYYDYIHNNSQKNAFITDNSGIIFEFTSAIVSNNYVTQPIYEPTNNIGFSDVSAIATIDILPSILNNLFYFQTTGPNLDTVLKYGINTQFNFALEYSDALVTCGNINSDNQIKNDYVNYLSYAITNLTLNPSTLFSNYNALIQGVQNMDSSFNQLLNNNFNLQNLQSGIVSFNNLNILLQNNTLNTFATSTKQLIDGMKYIASSDRKNSFLNDIANQSNNQNIYWVPFHTGDKLSIVIKYVPPNGNGNSIIGTNPVYTRSYKIVLNCLSIILPENMAHIAFNSKGNLDPMYCLRIMGVPLNSFVNSFNDLNYNDNESTINKIYKQIGPIVNLMDYYFKTFMSLETQPSTINNGLINNGINPSFQYIFLNSTITTILYPSLRTIKESLLTSPCDYYPTLNNLQDITCELNSVNSSNFIIRIYTRPLFNGIDNSLNDDSFFGNYYDSISLNGTTGYTSYNLTTLFPYWSALLTGSYVVNAYYNNNGFGYKQINTFGEQQILSICIFTTVLNSNIGIKNIELIYK
jgi:hypothetical protein